MAFERKNTWYEEIITIVKQNIWNYRVVFICELLCSRNKEFNVLSRVMIKE